jgi:hypothetical protein
MKNVFFIFCFSLMACSVFGQALGPCDQQQPDLRPWLINDAFGNDASQTVIIPENQSSVTIRYKMDIPGITELNYLFPASCKVRAVWDGCDKQGHQVTAVSSQKFADVIAVWERSTSPLLFSDCGLRKGWLGIDFSSACNPYYPIATLNVNIIQECKDECAHNGNCFRVINNHATTRCYKVTLGNQVYYISVPPLSYGEVCPCGPYNAQGFEQVPCGNYPQNIYCDNYPTYIGVEAMKANSSVSKANIYPSPANEVLNIKLPSDFKGETDVMVFDISGKLVFKEKIDASIEIKVATSDWLGGMYLVKLSNKQGQTTQKVMIQH